MIVRRLGFVVLAVLALILVSPSVTWAHDGHEHKNMGTVTMAAADHVMLKDREQKDVTVKVTKARRCRYSTIVKISRYPDSTSGVIFW